MFVIILTRGGGAKVKNGGFIKFFINNFEKRRGVLLTKTTRQGKNEKTENYFNTILLS